MFLRVCKDQSPSDIVQYTHPSFGLSLPPAVYPLYRLSEKKKMKYNTTQIKLKSCVMEIKRTFIHWLRSLRTRRQCFPNKLIANRY